MSYIESDRNLNQKKPDEKIQAELPSIKKNVERSVTYFKKNYERFHHFQRFAFKTALTPNDTAALNTTGKPTIEFNITNAPISRLCGEFSKQEPSIEVSAQFGAKIDPEVIEVVDGHLRHILFESKKHNTQYNTYRDSISGGFSTMKVWTDFQHEMSFDQDIFFGKSKNPTLVGFDPMATDVDKSDAEYCFEIFPMDKEQFKQDYPDVNIEDLAFVKMENAFSWSYKNQEQYVVLLCHYYKKKRVKKKIVKLADEQVMLESLYPEFEKEWQKQGRIEQPPAIVDTRTSEFTSICRYLVMETQVLEYVETSFKYQPLVFTDGDSVVVQEDSSSTMEQFTKPYIYHAEGLQRLTNLAGQMIGNDFENMVMHKFIVAEESLPEQEEALNAYSNVQQAGTLIYKSIYDDNPEHTLPAPQPVTRVPLPQEVIATFNNSMAMLQNILGSYDAGIAQNENQISGVAIVEAATLSNAAAMPYVVNYMQALNQVANIIVDLIPKYYKTPRTIPVLTKDGKRSSVSINGPGDIKLNYNSNLLKVKVEAGVNFSIAKNKALQQLTLLMKVSPEFAEFMNEVGLETLLDNIEFRNSDILKAKVESWQKMKEEKAKNQPSPEDIEAKAKAEQTEIQRKVVENEVQKTQLKGEEVAGKAMLDTEKLLLDKEKIANERLKIMQQAGASHNEMIAGLARADAEEERARADLHIKAHSEGHKQGHETARLLHEMEQANKPERKET